MQFKAFKPQALNKIAGAMGYKGDMSKFQQFVESDPQRKAQMNGYTNAARMMARGGLVNMNVGGMLGAGLGNLFGQQKAPKKPTDNSNKQNQGQLGQFAADLQKQRDAFNAQNQQTINQSNAAMQQLQQQQQGTPATNRVSTGAIALGVEPEPKKLSIGDMAALGMATPQYFPIDQGDGTDQFGRPMQRQIADSDLEEYKSNMAQQSQAPQGQPTTGLASRQITNELQRKQKDNEQQIFQQLGFNNNEEFVNAQKDLYNRGDFAGLQALSERYKSVAEPLIQQFRVDNKELIDAQKDIDFRQRQQQMARMAALTATGAFYPQNNNFISANPAMSGGTPSPTALSQSSSQDAEATTPSAEATTPSYEAPTQATTPTTEQFVSNPVTKSTPVTKPVLDEDGNPVLDADGNPTTEPVLDADGNPVMQTSLQIGDVTTNRMFDPRLAEGAVTQAQATGVGAEQFISEGTGALGGDPVAVSTAQAAISQADAVTEKTANTIQATQSVPGVNAALETVRAAQTNPDDPRAKVTAAQQTASSVGNLDAAQGNAILMDNPVQREIQDGELISGAANAEKAAQFTEQIQAAEATPSEQAMIQGQLENLTKDFDSANPPVWAAAALRNANARMAERGLGSSSIAGQAIIQATLEAALPIAQADAKTQAAFESQNLSNRQQRAMLAAEQRAKFIGQEFDQEFQARVKNASRIADVANQNFTAEQTVALENSRIANTMNLNNLSNRQALVIAEASALANMDLSNLNNRQQASVQNAQNFLSMDMANLSNRQQTDLFTAQQRVQSMFTDAAALNAASQFNASSQNQTDQFFANLASVVSQFNASQSNAQGQFNAGQLNTVERFNAELNNQRDQFEAQNQLVIAQSNAQWRREIATADTAAVNRANELNASAVLDISKQAYDNLWNYYADTMEWAWTSAESSLDRINALAIAELDSKTRSSIAGEQSKSAAGNAIGQLIGTLGSAMIICHVAREVYGPDNSQWFVFRTWLKFDAPRWFEKLYRKYGKQYASVIKHVPPLKWATKQFMDFIIDSKRKKHNVKTV